jgi:anti-anti-sigma factor
MDFSVFLERLAEACHVRGMTDARAAADGSAQSESGNMAKHGCADARLCSLQGRGHSAMQTDLKVAGDLDDAFASGANSLIGSIASELRDITVDMSEVEQLEPATLSVLIHLHKQLSARGHKIRVIGATSELIRRFENFHLAELFIEKQPAVH